MEAYTFRPGDQNDLVAAKQLTLNSWSRYKNALSADNWERLHRTLSNEATYRRLFTTADAIVCASETGRLVGMVFLVPRGNPDAIYLSEWAQLRFLTVDPDWEDKGIGRALTLKCLERAHENGEQVVALHTSELMQRAQALYEKLGFRRLREIDQRLGKRYWLYIKEL